MRWGCAQSEGVSPGPQGDGNRTGLERSALCRGGKWACVGVPPAVEAGGRGPGASSATVRSRAASPRRGCGLTVPRPLLSGGGIGAAPTAATAGGMQLRSDGCRGSWYASQQSRALCRTQTQ